MNFFLISRRFANKSPAKTIAKPINSIEVHGEWSEVVDPKGSGQTYWWNKKTNETTSLGLAFT